MMQQHLAKMMADVDVPGAMGWGAEDQAGEEDEEQIEEEEEGRPPLSAEEQAAAAAAAADDNEIELAEDEEEGGEGGAAGGAAAAAAAGEGGAPVDAELEALARAPGPTDAAKAAKDAEKEAAAAASAVERAAAARQKETARGEPRNWDDMSDGEQEGERWWRWWCVSVWLGGSRRVAACSGRWRMALSCRQGSAGLGWQGVEPERALMPARP